MTKNLTNPTASRTRALRRHTTWAEKRLWRILRSRRLAGYKFRRQYMEPPCYLDFYCLEAKLCIELDGFGHGFPDQMEHDRKRDKALADRGILVKRIWNHQLLESEGRDQVKENIWLLLRARFPHPGNVPVPPYRREPDRPERPSP